MKDVRYYKKNQKNVLLDNGMTIQEYEDSKLQIAQQKEEQRLNSTTVFDMFMNLLFVKSR